MASPVQHTRNGREPYVPPTGIKTHYVTLDFESSSYWLFEAPDVPDPVFPDTWKALPAKFCRWWVTDQGRPDDLRDVYGVLQLPNPVSATELRELVDSNMQLILVPCTLAIQAGYIPPLQECQKFVIHEYGLQRFPKSVAKLPSYNSNLTKSQMRYARIAINLGMNPREASKPENVVEFFRQRRLNRAPSKNNTAPPNYKRKRTSPPPTPVKHLTQSLGDIPDPDYDPDMPCFDDSDGHISDEEINNMY